MRGSFRFPCIEGNSVTLNFFSIYTCFPRMVPAMLSASFRYAHVLDSNSRPNVRSHTFIKIDLGADWSSCDSPTTSCMSYARRGKPQPCSHYYISLGIPLPLPALALLHGFLLVALSCLQRARLKATSGIITDNVRSTESTVDNTKYWALSAWLWTRALPAAYMKESRKIDYDHIMTEEVARARNYH